MLTLTGRDEEFTLTNDEGRSAGRITMTAKFVPVDTKLEPRESLNNMGILRVDLLDGKDIVGADRSGKSDPFVVFTLNDQRVHKSQTKKKTLTPVWNETFNVTVPSRVGAVFAFEVFDWNQIEQAKSLGMGTVDLTDIEPFVASEKVVPIVSTKHGDKGEIRLRLVFTPEMIAKSRKNTSTFSTAGRAMTQLGAVPFGAGKGVVHGVGSVGKFAKGVFSKPKSIDERDESSEGSEVAAGQVSAPAVPSIQKPAPNVATLAPGREGGPESGMLKVAVLGAKDLSTMGESSVKPYLVLRAGKEEFKTKHTGKTLTPEWDEVFNVAVSSETKSLNASIYDHKTLGKDKQLGEADIDIWRHLQANGSSLVLAADVWLELRSGTGQLHVRLEFERGLTRSLTGNSSGGSRVALGGSPSRFSLSRRHNDD
ncbi:hypothetical protein FRB99_006120 [Tulasnella sp. 403]|nr:hypothetical protein FRB99_006120 [Tulasnella sp. 403]